MKRGRVGGLAWVAWEVGRCHSWRVVDTLVGACPARSACSARRSVANFSAACYFTGIRLHDATKVPVGLIDSSAGGTNIYRWASTEALAACSQVRVQAAV